jgi:hypothetical protein
MRWCPPTLQCVSRNSAGGDRPRGEFRRSQLWQTKLFCAWGAAVGGLNNVAQGLARHCGVRQRPEGRNSEETEQLQRIFDAYELMFDLVTL